MALEKNISSGSILKATFPFISNDLRLSAVVNLETGKQTLEMTKIDLLSGEILSKDAIDCIHTAIMDIPVENFEELIEDSDHFMKRILHIRSSEKLREIHLEPHEKFKAFKSWVAGIAEAGLDAFRIQAEIENWGGLNPGYAIANRLMKFVAKYERDVLFDFILKIERECRFEGIKHEQSLIANLNPILKLVDENDFELISAILSIEPPINLFIKEKENMGFLRFPEICNLPDFNKAFKSDSSFVRLHLAQNPRATEFDEFQAFLKEEWLLKYILSNPGAVIFDELNKYLSYKTEKNWELRALIAGNLGGYRMKDYSNFYSNITEPEFLVRRRVASNPNAVKIDLFRNFLTDKTEPDARVRAAASANTEAAKFDEYKQFLSVHTEARSFVRNGAAKNPLAVRFPEFANFLFFITEPSIMVRINAAKNINAPEFDEYKNFLSNTTEPNYKIRKAAAENPNAIRFKEFKNLFDIDTEPVSIVRYKARKLKKQYQKIHR